MTIRTHQQIDLSPFCGPDECLYSLEEPWVVDGWKYASDGCVIVRVPAAGHPDSAPPRDGKIRVENVTKLFPPLKGRLKPWPSVEACQECKGSGAVRIDCKICRNIGFAKLFGNVVLSRHYAWLISNLHGVMYSRECDGSKPLRFNFEGGEGAVMGLSE